MCEMYDDTYNMNTLHLDMYYMQSTRSFEMCRSIRTLSTVDCDRANFEYNF